MPNYEHNIQKQKLHQTFETIKKKYTTEPAKVHLNSVIGNHKKSFNHEKHRTDTELSKEYWRLKELKAQPQVQFSILKRCPPTKRTGICYLCLKRETVYH